MWTTGAQKKIFTTPHNSFCKSKKWIHKYCRSGCLIVSTSVKQGRLQYVCKTKRQLAVHNLLGQKLKMLSFLNPIFLISFHLIPSQHYVNPILLLSLSVCRYIVLLCKSTWSFLLPQFGFCSADSLFIFLSRFDLLKRRMSK